MPSEIYVHIMSEEQVRFLVVFVDQRTLFEKPRHFLPLGMENFKKAFEKKPAEDVHDPKKNLN
jgi:hypothetical protein